MWPFGVGFRAIDEMVVFQDAAVIRQAVAGRSLLMG